MSNNVSPRSSRAGIASAPPTDVGAVMSAGGSSTPRRRDRTRGERRRVADGRLPNDGLGDGLGGRRGRPARAGRATGRELRVSALLGGHLPRRPARTPARPPRRRPLTRPSGPHRSGEECSNRSSARSRWRSTLPVWASPPPRGATPVPRSPLAIAYVSLRPGRLGMRVVRWGSRPQTVTEGGERVCRPLL